MFTTLRNTLFVFLLSLSAAFAAEENVSREIDATPGGKLVVDVDYGSIDVGVGSEGKVVLGAYRMVEVGNETKEKEYLAAAPITVTKEGDVVAVRAHRQGSWSNWHFGYSRNEASYTLHVPKTFNLDL